MSDTNPKKVVLAYSGGLDTSVIAHWLMRTYDCEVVTFTADIGQEEEGEMARLMAQELGIKEIFVEDLREEFARDFIFPMFRANALYEGEYLLGTAIARPLIARRLVEIARETGADAIAHGATGKGNDQVRFELAALALAPDLRMIAPWRTWEFQGRADLVAYCRQHDVSMQQGHGGTVPFSMDANLLHISYEGGDLEDPDTPPKSSMWQRTRSVADAPVQGMELTLSFADGNPVAIDGEAMPPAVLMQRLNQLAGIHAIGRADIVENRYLGLKSRGCYETPAGTVLLKARRALESVVLDAGLAHLKDSLLSRYAELVYNGYWFSPEREAIQALVDCHRQWLAGDVRLYLHKGALQVLGRSSPYSLYDRDAVSFELAGDDSKADAGGFIRMHAISLRAVAARAASHAEGRKKRK